MHKKTLLICDDDPDILDVLELAFKTHFHTICEADSLKVMDLLRSNKPDIVLLDLWMPFLSGDQLIRAIRRDEDLKELRVIAISASQTGKKVALGAGADSFIAKPFDLDELLMEIRSLSGQTVA
jgi:DNA-binding response OmpR family regulator